jgi:hypothetical protein
MEVTVIDQSDLTGWMASATRLGEISIVSTQDMVQKVLYHIGSSKMTRLNILDHGNPLGLEIGYDWITLITLPGYEPILSQLKGHFAQNGFVHLQHCQLGRNELLLRRLADIMNVLICAGTGNHNPVYRFNTRGLCMGFTQWYNNKSRRQTVINKKFNLTIITINLILTLLCFLIIGVRELLADLNDKLDILIFGIIWAYILFIPMSSLYLFFKKAGVVTSFRINLNRFVILIWFGFILWSTTMHF